MHFKIITSLLFTFMKFITCSDRQLFSRMFKPIINKISKHIKSGEHSTNDHNNNNLNDPNKSNELIILNETHLSDELFENLEKIDFLKSGNEVTISHKHNKNIYFKIIKLENNNIIPNKYQIKITKKFLEFFKNYQNNSDLNLFFSSFKILDQTIKSDNTKLENNNSDLNSNSSDIVIYLNGLKALGTTNTEYSILNLSNNVSNNFTDIKTKQVKESSKVNTSVPPSDIENDFSLKDFLSLLNNELETNYRHFSNFSETANSGNLTSKSNNNDGIIAYKIGNETNVKGFEYYKIVTINPIISKNNSQEEEKGKIKGINLDNYCSSNDCLNQTQKLIPKNTAQPSENYGTTLIPEIQKINTKILTKTEKSRNVRRKNKRQKKLKHNPVRESKTSLNATDTNYNLTTNSGVLNTTVNDINATLKLDDEKFNKDISLTTEMYDFTENNTLNIHNNTKDFTKTNDENNFNKIFNDTQNDNTMIYTSSTMSSIFSNTNSSKKIINNKIIDSNLDSDKQFNYTEINDIKNQNLTLNVVNEKIYNQTEFENNNQKTEIKPLDNDRIKNPSIALQNSNLGSESGGISFNGLAKTGGNFVGEAGSSLLSGTADKFINKAENSINILRTLKDLATFRSGGIRLNSNAIQQSIPLGLGNKGKKNNNLEPNSEATQRKNKQKTRNKLTQTTSKPQTEVNRESIRTRKSVTPANTDKSQKSENNLKESKNIDQKTPRQNNGMNTSDNKKVKTTKQTTTNNKNHPSKTMTTKKHENFYPTNQNATKFNYLNGIISLIL